MNVGLAAVVYLLLARRIDRRLEPGRVVENIRSEINGIIVELNQTTDRNIGLIEDRVNRLNGVLEQADRRLSVLKREVESRSSSTQRYNDILEKARTPGTAPAPGASSQSVRPVSDGRSGDEGPGGDVPGGSRDASGGPAADVPGANADGGAGVDAGAGVNSVAGNGDLPGASRAERRRRIVDLHRKGIASNIIANRVGSTVGEVELIISLADRKE